MNFELFKNFKEAAQRCNLEVIPGHNFYRIDIPNSKKYIFCWTPINKLFMVTDQLEMKNYDEALNEFSKLNFHLEIDSHGHQENVMEAFIDVDSYNASVDEIVNVIKTLQNDEAIQKRLIWNRLKYDE
jgi:hypothetical protein